MYSLIKLPQRKNNTNEYENETINLDDISDSDDKFEAMKQRIQYEIKQDDENASNESDLNGLPINDAYQFKFNDMIESDEDDDIINNKQNIKVLQPLLSNQQHNVKSTDDECEQSNDEDLFVLSDSYLKYRYNSSSDELPLDEIGKYKSPINHYGLHCASAKMVPKIKIPIGEKKDYNIFSKYSAFQMPLEINDIIESDNDNYINDKQEKQFEHKEGINDVKMSETLMGYTDLIDKCDNDIENNEEQSVTLMGYAKNINDEIDDSGDMLNVGVTLMGYTKNEDSVLDDSNIESNDELMFIEVETLTVTLLGFCKDKEKILLQ